jgi:hypothetical protein
LVIAAKKKAMTTPVRPKNDPQNRISAVSAPSSNAVFRLL